MNYLKSVFRALTSARVGFRLLVAVDVLLFGVVGMNILARMKVPPAEVQQPKPVIRVEAKKVQPENIQVYITGYGSVKALKSVRVAPAVAGKIIKVHSQLVAGRFLEQDEILFEIDKRDYLSAYKDARANLSQIANSIERLQLEQKTATARLKTLSRNRDLVKAEFESLSQLYQKSKIGTRSQVDAAERSYNAAMDQLVQMQQAVDIYPLQIKDMGFRLESAKAGVFRTSTNLKRSSVRAPFSGRIKDVSLEVGQYVAPGQGLIQLVDDTTLEIDVPIDSSDARKWLKFSDQSDSQSNIWFSALQQSPVRIQWTEDATGHTWQGSLHRIKKYDQQTRTLILVVRANNKATVTKKGILPLVEGMFCSVIIPGKIMRQVYRLPRWAVGVNNTVFLSDNGRLKTVPVTVSRIQADEVFVSGGLTTDDNVITTRLINPLENSLLEIVTQN
ncbi:MAG: HlyD family efflux transporter periplasmic adaptor subunit [Deltaproteobacteria bacterium]|nr:HlyD family efflux transporter periplasmic adaptor subunit [Deltaproteobacteria bacterium]